MLTDKPDLRRLEYQGALSVGVRAGFVLRPSRIAGCCSGGGHSRNAARATTLEQQGKTLVMLMDEGRVQALFAVADTLKSYSRDSITQLHQLGVNTLMPSGDNTPTAKAVAAQVVSTRRMATCCRQINCIRRCFAPHADGAGSMWMAVFADVGTSLLIVANGLLYCARRRTSGKRSRCIKPLSSADGQPRYAVTAMRYERRL